MTMDAVTHMELVELYMTSKYDGVPCAVFFDPLGNGTRITLFKERFGITGGTALAELIHSDVAVLRVENPALIVNAMAEDEWGFVMAWDGKKFTTENT